MNSERGTINASTCRRYVLILAAVVVFASALVGCGGGSDEESAQARNDAAISEAETTAERTQASEQEVTATLRQSLDLTTYSGVKNAFRLESGDWCSIASVEQHEPSDQPIQPEETLVSPDGTTWVLVSYFVGETAADDAAIRAECLKATQDALGW